MSGIGFFLTAKIALMDFLKPDVLLFEKVAKVRQGNGFSQSRILSVARNDNDYKSEKSLDKVWTGRVVTSKKWAGSQFLKRHYLHTCVPSSTLSKSSIPFVSAKGT